MPMTKEMHVEYSNLAWRKSTRSGPVNDNCVEVAPVGDGSVAMRHSKHPEGPVLAFTAAEWAAFAGGMGDGEFDDLIA